MVLFLSLGTGSAALVLTSRPQPTGNHCPGPITFTCVGTEISTSLFWLLNNSQVHVAAYYYHNADTFPLIVHQDQNIRVEVISVLASPMSNFYDISSTFRVANLSVLIGDFISCEDSSSSSNMLQVNSSAYFSKFVATELHDSHQM